jgi:hypothetical protein
MTELAKNTLLASFLQDHGYNHSLSQIPLDNVLDWIFSIEETRPFVQWLCDRIHGVALSKDGLPYRWNGLAVLNTKTGLRSQTGDATAAAIDFDRSKFLDSSALL